MIHDIATGADILYDFASAPVGSYPVNSPSGQYTAWAAELGVSSTTSYSALPTTGLCEALNLSFAPLLNSTFNKVYIGNAGLSFYKVTPTVTAASQYTDVAVPSGQEPLHFYNADYPTPPSFILAHCVPNAAAGALSGVGRMRYGLWQQTSTEAIFYLEFEGTYHPADNVSSCAIRISHGRVEILGAAAFNTEGTVYTQGLCADQSGDITVYTGGGLSTTGGFTSPAYPTGAATTRRYVSGLPQTSGFNTTNFGTPNLPALIFVQPTGFKPTAFGTPARFIATTSTAQGWLATHVSTVAQGPYDWILGAGGRVTTVVGSPRGGARAYASPPGTVTFGTPTGRIGWTTQFGLPSLVPATHGQPPATRFGPPSSYRGGTPPNWIVQAAPVMPGGLGLPASSLGALTKAATGFKSTALGSHGLRRGLYATGSSTTALGASLKAPRTAHASPLATTQLGQGRVGVGMAAQGLLGLRGLGTPIATRSRTYLTQGFSLAGRFPRPSASTRAPAKPAAGFLAPHLGAPSAHQSNHAAHTAPGTRFGAANLKQVLTC
jgi:hypothetical protein